MKLIPLWPLMEMSRDLRAQGINVAHGAYNMNSLVHIKAAIDVAQELNSPLIAQGSEGANGWYSGRPDFRNATLDEKMKGARKIAADVSAYAAQASVPVVLHLDHGVDPDFAIAAIEEGYTSVMYDGSSLPLEQNIANTRRVVEAAHKKGASVEGEIGGLAGAEEGIEHETAKYTDPDEAERYVAETGVDALAISYGTSHGEFKGKVNLKLEIAGEVYGRIRKNGYQCELVSHGSSSLPEHLLSGLVEQIRAAGYADQFKRPDPGVPVEMLMKASRYGISKINVDADIRLATTMYVWEYFNKNADARKDPVTGKMWELMIAEPSKSRPRYYMTPIQQQMIAEDRSNPHVSGILDCIAEGVKLVLRERIQQLGGAGRAGEVEVRGIEDMAREYAAA
ncbi:MAG: fructose-bisphosphate aldolase [Chitinivibrionales bacterium]|nr:fructose-bisphosphate aldolase [Chitinivibrionales bacterium]MBD3394433.1 fructose-bisphosphate aldolase [Chitinivibrionales bacterium]